jgi:hypothetical protein
MRQRSRPDAGRLVFSARVDLLPRPGRTSLDPRHVPILIEVAVWNPLIGRSRL